ncbi:hypothetical protein P7K49_012487 [Saguinus oedipus]|uniref:Uncharacterized protein n=1 Tax=Saguinus oedipus TaxID=9490 RepID=A0ABQ9VUD4_SAGOE|nr:hypothetical protein P7K49_012487 [Saguinus oedipus]
MRRRERARERARDGGRSRGSCPRGWAWTRAPPRPAPPRPAPPGAPGTSRRVPGLSARSSPGREGRGLEGEEGLAAEGRRRCVPRLPRELRCSACDSRRPRAAAALRQSRRRGLA